VVITIASGTPSRIRLDASILLMRETAENKCFGCAYWSSQIEVQDE
jgi:hypothetical protein